MLKKPMTTEELFDKIKGILKEKNKLPEILDYGLGAYHPVPIRTYEFDLKSNLAYGGSEGIYLDLWIEYFVDDEKHTSSIGTFKTLHESKEAMHTMAPLLADFILEEKAYVNANLDDFTWEGADVYPFDEVGNRLKWGYSCSSMEAALKRKDELIEKYPQVIVRDNATRKEKVFKQSSRKERRGKEKHEPV
jgi:hypothetical protein